MAKGRIAQVIGTVVDLEFPPDQLPEGTEAVDTGSPISVPVGRASLGRLFDVAGTAIDDLGEVKASEYWPIHRAPPSFDEQETSPQLLETGLKVIDLTSYEGRKNRGIRWCRSRKDGCNPGAYSKYCHRAWRVLGFCRSGRTFP